MITARSPDSPAYALRKYQPAKQPASSGTKVSAKTQLGNCPGPGSAARSGRPGTAPRCDPVRSTDVSVPSENPGPISADAVHSTRFGSIDKHRIASAIPPKNPGSNADQRSPALSKWSASITANRANAETSRAI